MRFKQVDTLGRIVKLRFLLFFVLALFNCIAFAQGNSSNQGKEFWTTYMSHTEDNGPSQMSLYITSDLNTSGTVEVADGSFSVPFTVVARQVTIVDIPHTAFLKLGGQYLKGIHITALKNIAIYAHIYANAVSGATLLLPVNVLGKNYTSINYTQKSNAVSYSSLAVIAVEDNTTVEITPSVPLLDGKQANTKFELSLKKGEVYQALANTDLTGTLVKSISSTAGECKKIAVFSGSSKISISCNISYNSADNLFQQVYPTSSWGKNYLTAPLKSRPIDIFRIVLSDLNTVVKMNGNVVIDGTGNLLYYEFKSSTTNTITADKPIQVVQYAVTEGNSFDNNCTPNTTDRGDPEMIYLTPLEQTLDHVTLYSTDKSKITANFINVVIKTSSAPSFQLDGVLYSNLANGVNNMPFATVPGNEEYSYAQIKVDAGTHFINADEGFTAIAYGFGARESYGYAAGANVKDLNSFIFIAGKQSNETVTSGCAGSAYKLKLTIPYQTTSIKWDFKDGSAPYVDNAPVVASTIQRDSKTLYTYEYYKTVTFAPGEYNITGTVRNPTSDDCGSDVPIDFDFIISGLPVSKFSWAGTCPGEDILFKDESTPPETIKTWLWDFGDGTTSTLQTPKHLYATGGKYTVRLTVGNEAGCTTTAENVLTILNKPKAAFNVPAPYCFGQAVTLADASTSTGGAIKQWIWDFGDGTPIETHTTGVSFTHIFSKSGNSTMQLTVVTENGCTDITQKVIEIKVVPVVDFSLPDVCLSDAVAKFTDKSSIPDGSEGAFTYLWNFGDANANAANPNTSTLKNPGHKYNRASNYTVTLTITSSAGCSVTKTQTLTVNGDTPSARFLVDNSNQLCSAAPVTFHDQSTVNFGNVTKIVWYYDYVNSPTANETFLRADIPDDRTYHHNYAVFNTPLTKQFTVRMEAYSGESCVDITQQIIMVNANPLVQLLQIGSICYNAPPIQIAVNSNGFSGNGSFTGRGVTNSGMFSPKTAGAGISTISYTFVATNGCSYTTNQDILVYDELTANAGEDITALDGITITLKGSDNQTNVTYKWSPSAGLDRDDIAEPTVTPTRDITYRLTVTNANGCVTTDDVFLHILEKPIVVNTFTPNNDGINDVWNIKYLESYPGNTVEIYNRQGEKVYSSIGYAIPWDGRYKGKELPVGTYYYIINPKNGRKVIAGNVTIIR
ncbi:PKD domain-containing protein [Mucilaginibacter glaciei]|uniref:PKD domain-containing protein n=1 Tax=Mucilaginibacter glaciei TaxID=2772109 RepID=A0A926S0I8_9SPHI|nr:PKD domain-containing protein [Mucilaginibacter glaciei]MBD1391782.1 PKD domain-containing protein [Mucilaginibacter glaciei]